MVLARERVDVLLVTSVPRVATTSAWVSPRVNSAEPWVRGSTPVRISIARTSRVAAVDAGLAGQNLSTDDLASMSNSTLPTSLVGRRCPAHCFFPASARRCETSFNLDERPACRGSGKPDQVGFRRLRLRAAISASFFAPAFQSTGLPPSRTSSWIARSRSASARGRTPRHRASLLRTFASLPIRPSARAFGAGDDEVELRFLRSSVASGSARTRRSM